jgi:hypothetical protein
MATADLEKAVDKALAAFPAPAFHDDEEHSILPFAAGEERSICSFATQSTLQTATSSVFLQSEPGVTPALLKAIVKHLVETTPESPAESILELLTHCDSLGQEGLKKKVDALLKEIAESEQNINALIDELESLGYDYIEEEEVN